MDSSLHDNYKWEDYENGANSYIEIIRNKKIDDSVITGKIGINHSFRPIFFCFIQLKSHRLGVLKSLRIILKYRLPQSLLTIQHEQKLTT